MRQPRRRSSFFKILLLVIVVAFLVYVNITIEPLTPTLFLPSPTPTISPETFVAEAEELASQGKYLLALQAYDKLLWRILRIQQITLRPRALIYMVENMTRQSRMPVMLCCSIKITVWGKLSRVSRWACRVIIWMLKHLWIGRLNWIPATQPHTPFYLSCSLIRSWLEFFVRIKIEWVYAFWCTNVISARDNALYSNQHHATCHQQQGYQYHSA